MWKMEPAVTRALEPAQRGRQTEGKTSKRAPGHSSTLDDRSGSLVVFYQYWRGSFHKDRYAGPSPPYWGQQSPMHPRQISTTTSTTSIHDNLHKRPLRFSLRSWYLRRTALPESRWTITGARRPVHSSCLGKLCPAALGQAAPRYTLEITCTSPGDSCESS